jgi:hypothetical protein
MQVRNLTLIVKYCNSVNSKGKQEVVVATPLIRIQTPRYAFSLPSAGFVGSPGFKAIHCVTHSLTSYSEGL